MHAHILKELSAARDFVQLVRGRRPALRRRRLPRQLPPDTIRLAYFGDLRTLIRGAKKLVDARLVPRLPDIVAASALARGEAVPRGDDEKNRPAEVNVLVEQISRDFNGRLSRATLQDIAARYAVATSDFQREQLGRQLRAGLGVDVPIRDGALGARLEQFTARNVSLIRSIPERYFTQVESKVLDGVEQGKRWEDIADDLEERYEVSESTAQLIARDQVGKLYGGLNEERQTELGIEGFLWRTSNDDRVRETHRQLEGRSYSWDEPPDEETGEPDPDGVIPGEPVNCRCNAEPDLSSVLDSL